MSQQQPQILRQLDSEETIEIEVPFRVRAGPGAGKTHWLVKHIKNVLHHSQRLGRASKIACISYTEVAATELSTRLGDAADRVDVSTIHSFLYNNIVRPYLHLLKDENGSPLVSSHVVDGHDKHQASIGRFRKCAKERKSILLLKDMDKHEDNLIRCLSNLTWTLDKSGWELVAKIERPPLNLPQSDLIKYKKTYWENGTIHHDDVLYFAHRLLLEYPTLCDFLSSRYPYLFIDEFQDTTPPQTEIARWLSARGTTVGVIGDPEQSIYEFTGARPADFTALDVPGLVDYEIRGNRRSTKPIIELINTIRRDGLLQNAIRTDASPPIVLLIGDQREVLREAHERLKSHTQESASYAVLFRRNRDVHTIRAEHVHGVSSTNHWKELDDKETNLPRQRFIRCVAEASSYLQHKRFDNAIRTLTKGVRRIVKGDQPDSHDFSTRHITVELIEYLASNYSVLQDKKILDVYGEVLQKLESAGARSELSKITGGKPKEFALGTRFGDLVATADVADQHHSIRTIHSTKGAEFESVFVWLDSEGISKIFGEKSSSKKKQRADADEERRVLYVALSRSRSMLILGAPGPIDEKARGTAEQMNIQIIDLPRAS